MSVCKPFDCIIPQCIMRVKQNFLRNLMGALVSAEMKYAIHLVMVDGKSVYEAARMAGVHPASVYKSLKNDDKNIPKKRLANRSA